jgi:CopG family nickel-responsive transcriptional regulator
MSINKSLLDKFDKLSNKKGYTTRSEAFRDAIRKVIREGVWEEEIGDNMAVIMVLYDKSRPKTAMTVLLHQFEEIQTNIHMHLDDSNCLEIFVAKGEGNVLKKIIKRIREIKGTKHVEFITTACDI